MPSDTLLTPELCRAGRALIDIPQSYLAELSGVSERTIRSFEAERSTPIPNNIRALQLALEKCTVEFVRFGGGQVAVATRVRPRATGAAAQYVRTKAPVGG